MGTLLARARDRASATPLRLRLVAILLGLALVALAVTGAVAVALLGGQLVDKVDAQVTAVARGYAGLDSPDDLGGGPQRGLPSAQYGVVLLDTGQQLQIGRRLGRGPGPDLAGLTPASVAAHRGLPFTVPATSGDARWRLVTLRVAGTQYGDVTLVVGQSLADVDDTVARMGVVLTLVGLVVLVALGLLGWLAVRRAFRPLTEVEEVAQAIADGDLSRRVPPKPSSTGSRRP